MVSSPFCVVFRSFLLTPLREGRQPADDGAIPDGLISTHAPAGGATRGLVHVQEDLRISTHAPAGGATSPGRSGRPCKRFLLTPLREGRRIKSTLAFLAGMLFLLTPLREGRRPFSAFCRIPRRFLLTPLREGRHLLTNITTTKRVSFLLTPLREGRRSTRAMKPR